MCPRHRDPCRKWHVQALEEVAGARICALREKKKAKFLDRQKTAHVAIVRCMSRSRHHNMFVFRRCFHGAFDLLSSGALNFTFWQCTITTGFLGALFLSWCISKRRDVLFLSLFFVCFSSVHNRLANLVATATDNQVSPTKCFNCHSS